MRSVLTTFLMDNYGVFFMICMAVEVSKTVQVLSWINPYFPIMLN